MEELEEFDKLKTKVLKYVLYKKRSEAEVRRKFADANDEMLDEVIQNLSENGYINDNSYIEKAVQEFMRLKNMSIKEIEYKLLSKGINKDKIENYIFENSAAQLIECVNMLTMLYFVNGNIVLMLCRKMKTVRSRSP